MGDLKGHSDASQDVHNFLSMYRPRSSDRGDGAGPDGLYDAGVVVMKCRDNRGGEGTVELRYDKDAMRFLDPVEVDMFGGYG